MISQKASLLCLGAGCELGGSYCRVFEEAGGASSLRAMSLGARRRAPAATDRGSSVVLIGQLYTFASRANTSSEETNPSRLIVHATECRGCTISMSRGGG